MSVSMPSTCTASRWREEGVCQVRACFPVVGVARGVVQSSRPGLTPPAPPPPPPPTPAHTPTPSDDPVLSETTILVRCVCNGFSRCPLPRAPRLTCPSCPLVAPANSATHCSGSLSKGCPCSLQLAQARAPTSACVGLAEISRSFHPPAHRMSANRTEMWSVQRPFPPPPPPPPLHPPQLPSVLPLRVCVTDSDCTGGMKCDSVATGAAMWAYLTALGAVQVPWRPP